MPPLIPVYPCRFIDFIGPFSGRTTPNGIRVKDDELCRFLCGENALERREKKRGDRPSVNETRSPDGVAVHTTTPHVSFGIGQIGPEFAIRRPMALSPTCGTYMLSVLSKPMVQRPSAPPSVIGLDPCR